MNRFVIVAEEDYDQFTVAVAYPLETELTREEVQAVLQNAADRVVARWTNNIHNWLHEPVLYLKLREESFLGGHYLAYVPKLPILYTLDEWFETQKALHNLKL